MASAARGDAWERVRHPRGPVTRVLRRAGLSALGTYGAYLVYGVRHPALLRSAATQAERDEALPGDDIVTAPSWVTDFATDVAAPPADVWPWLAQMGYGRAGWYTWFPLDNGGVPSADVIVPALQEVRVGDYFPDGARAVDGFGQWRVETLDPPHALVLHSRRDVVNGYEIPPGDEPWHSFLDCTWVFVLSEPRPDATRLHVRVRAELRGKAWIAPVARAARVLFGLGDNVMENTLLRGIRERAERVRASIRVAE